MTEDVLLSFGTTIRQKLELVQAERKTARAVFAIFVEETQNIIRYSRDVLPEVDEDDDESVVLRHGFLAVGKSEGRYFVCCGNLILESDVERLQTQLSHIKSLDPDALNALYKDILRGDVPDGSKGAGVGFVDIARRAKGEFDFEFMPVKNGYSYFYLKAFA